MAVENIPSKSQDTNVTHVLTLIYVESANLVENIVNTVNTLSVRLQVKASLIISKLSNRSWRTIMRHYFLIG